MQRKISLLLAAAVAAGGVGISSMGTEKAEAYDSVKVVVNNTELTGDSAGVIVDGRTLVPVRAVSEMVGADVDWDGGTRTATVKLNGKTISIPIDSYTIYSGGSEVSVDVPAQIINDRTMLPLRAVGEQLGLDVDWVGDEKTAYMYDADITVPSPYSFCGYNMKIMDHLHTQEKNKYHEYSYQSLSMMDGLLDEEDWIEEYAELLEDKYNFTLVDDEIDDSLLSVGVRYHNYYFKYNGGKVEPVNDKGNAVQLTCALHYSASLYSAANTYTFAIHLSNDLVMAETGDRTSYKLTNTNPEYSEKVSSSGSSGGGSSTDTGSDGLFCMSCGGTGRCSFCGGSGYVERYQAGGKTKRQTCSACFGGKCKACGGDGRVGN